MTMTGVSDNVALASAAGAAVEPAEAREGGSSRARRIAFRVLAVLTSLLVTMLMIIAVTEVVLMWLPWDTLMSLIDDLPAGDEMHRGHFNIVGIVGWALVLGVVVQLRKPERRVAPILQAVGIVVTSAVVYGLSGTVGEWLAEEVTLLVPVLLLAVLHPQARDLIRMPGMDRTMVGLVGVAAVPWLVFAVDHALLQWRNVAGDAHAALEHWATAALLGVVILWCGLLGSSDHPGWRLPAWIAALASIEYGLHSVVFPDVASAASTFWAVGAILWGAAFAVATFARSRRRTPAGSPRTDPAHLDPVA
jgi:hypothetical protein